ncbi:MAG: DUF4159 domain-containing protein [Bacteroidota bacterium]|nr:DUF4159 domain-containing protein [Bacteroidota bacterium]
MFKYISISVVAFLFVGFWGVSSAQNTYSIGLLKYNGGGDWYANPTSLPNLIDFCNKNLRTSINKEPVTVEVSSADIFNYPLIHMTGHGNVVFSPGEAENLRLYLQSGGFLHVDDNYGMDKFFRREMKKVFPNNEFQELPFSHPVFHQKYDFRQGLPKIHEHDNKPPQAFGIFIENRLVCLYTYESDIGDGWEDQSVHNDPENLRQKALKMGANIVNYVFTGEVLSLSKNK